MSQAEESTLQQMYEYQKLAAPNKSEYVVRGAKVSCAYGSKDCALNLPADHGVFTADGRPLITISDSARENISGFGNCSLTEKTCSPSLEKWTYDKSSKKIYNVKSAKEEYAVTRASTAVCKNAGSGVVLFESSGQVVADYSDKKVDGAVDITEDIKKSWTRGTDGKDFLGHLKALHSGIYNFGIFKKDVKIEGTLFLYKKAKSNSPLKFMGAYELCDHKNEAKEGFKDEEYTIKIYEDDRPNVVETKEFYWTMWVEMVLEKDIDYYFEIDCPDMDGYDYKLIGNLEHGRLILDSKDVKDDRIAGAWLIDGNYKTTYSDNYELVRKEYELGVPVMVLYLNDWYKMIFGDVLVSQVFEEQTLFNKNNVANGLSVVSLIVPIGGTYLSVLALMVTYLPDDLRKQISESILKCAGDKAKLTVYDNDDPKRWVYDIENPLRGVYRQIYKYEIEEFSGTMVEGTKYLKGQMRLFPGFSTKQSSAAVVEDIENMLKKGEFK